MLGLRDRDNGDSRIRPEVKEVQDDFLNVYRRVFDSEKSWAKRFTEESKPQTQKDFSVIQSVENKKDKLLRVLDETLSDIRSVKRDEDGEVKGEWQNFGYRYSIIQPYNEIIRMYLNPDNNSKTKEEIKSKIQEIAPLVNQIISVANSTFKSLFFPPYGLRGNQRIKEGVQTLAPMITTYIALLVMQKNLFRGTYSTINKPQLDVQYNEWLSYLTDDEREFMKTIETPTGASEALLERQRLIEEDRGYPLSAVERLNLRNSMFGISSNKQYSPAELAELEAEDRRDAAAYRDYREELNENRGLFGFERADLIGEDEEPIPDAAEFEEAEPEAAEFEEAEPEADEFEAAAGVAGPRPDRRLFEFNNFMTDIERRFNANLQAQLAPDKNIRKPIREQRAKIKDAIDFLIGAYRDGYRIINDSYPSMREEQRFIDDAINSQTDSSGEPNLTDESIFSEGDNPRGTERKRNDIYQSLSLALQYTANRADYRAERIGEGKPRRLMKKVSQAIHYNDAHNDPYLIR
jgi:hypothetical protein